MTDTARRIISLKQQIVTIDTLLKELKEYDRRMELLAQEFSELCQSPTLRARDKRLSVHRSASRSS